MLPVFKVRRYMSEDYPAVVRLYKNSDTFGGQFDEHRDSEKILFEQCQIDPDAILVAEADTHVAGTVSLIQNHRVAWLFRFAVEQGEHASMIEQALCDHASTILQDRGHKEVLVYSPTEHSELSKRYSKLNFLQGGTYTCFWRTL